MNSQMTHSILSERFSHFFSTKLFPEQELYKAERIEKVSFHAFFLKKILLPIQIPTACGMRSRNSGVWFLLIQTGFCFLGSHLEPTL